MGVLAPLECGLEPSQRNVDDSELCGNLLDTFHALVEHLALVDKVPAVPHRRRHRLTCVLGSVAVYSHVIKRVVGERGDRITSKVFGCASVLFFVRRAFVSLRWPPSFCAPRFAKWLRARFF